MRVLRYIAFEQRCFLASRSTDSYWVFKVVVQH